MRDYQVSQRRACKFVCVDPKTVRRERPPDNPDIREEMKAIASKRRRLGYRRAAGAQRNDHESQEAASTQRKSWASGGDGDANGRVDHERRCQ